MADELAKRLVSGAGALAAGFAAQAAGLPAPVQVAAGALVLAALALGLPAAAHRPAAPPAPAPRTGPDPDLAGPALMRLPRPLVLIDAGGRIVFANPAARALFERLRVGEHYSMSFRSPDFLDALGEALEHGAARAFDFALHGDRNRQIAAHVDGAAPPDADPDAPRQVLCLFEDRTHETRLARMRTDFVANASHELRTPLSSVKGFIETLQGAARDDPEARERFLGIMQAQAERMQRLIDDLLSLSRIELNEHIAPSGLLDLAALAREVAETLGPMARARRAALELALPVEGPKVRGDRDQLCQAIGNLIENALKYGEAAPVRLSLVADPDDRPGMIGLSVQDRGEGIAREHIPRLTERFYRVSVKRSRDQGGTGLGLAIVKHILTRHRGELGIESQLGQGSCFTLWLPEAAPEPPAPATRADAEVVAEAGDGAGTAPDARAKPAASAPSADGDAAEAARSPRSTSA